MKGVWQEIADLILGLRLIVSPWLLGFATHMTARSDAVAVGIVVAPLASLAMVVDGVVDGRFDSRTPFDAVAEGYANISFHINVGNIGRTSDRVHR